MVNSNWIFFRCDLCGEGFARNEGLKKHTLTHKINEGNLTEEEKKKLELQKKTCEFCGRKFDHPSAFYRHRKTHMGIKNHICSECGQAFTEKRYMDDHYNVKHLGLKNYPCEHCGKLFGSHNSLANHKKSIHGTGPSPQSSNVSKIVSWILWNMVTLIFCCHRFGRSLLVTFVEKLTSLREQGTLTMTKLIWAKKSFLARSVDWSLKDLVLFKLIWNKHIHLHLRKRGNANQWCKTCKQSIHLLIICCSKLKFYPHDFSEMFHPGTSGRINMNVIVACTSLCYARL